MAVAPAATGGATAYEPGRARDLTAPGRVAQLEPVQLSHEQLTVRWAAAEDNVGVTEYRVWLNGFQVAATTELSASLSWFNDESAQQIVQVVAVDAAGNLSQTTSLLLTRPAPSPLPGSEASTTPDPGAGHGVSPSPSAGDLGAQ